MAFTPRPWPRWLRSQEWFGGSSRSHICYRSRMKNQGFAANLFDGRKTTPSLLMAASTDLPSIVVTGGPMLNGWFRGKRVGQESIVGAFSSRPRQLALGRAAARRVCADIPQPHAGRRYWGRFRLPARLPRGGGRT